MEKVVGVGNPHIGKIGDTVLMEPACAAFAERNKARIALGCGAQHFDLFRNHPSITPYVFISDGECDHVLDTSKAFAWAAARRLPHAAGFFHQLGMEIQKGDRLHYRNYFAESIGRFKDSVILAPFAHSCHSHDSTTGKPNDKAPNLQPSREWWQPILDHPQMATRKVFVLCGANPDWDWEWEWPATVTVVRGLLMLETTVALSMCRFLISVNTGLLHITSGTKTPTIYLCSGTPPTLHSPNTDLSICAGNRADKISQATVVDQIRRFI